MSASPVIDMRFAGGPVELSVRREVIGLRRADGLDWLSVSTCPLRKAGGGQPADHGMVAFGPRAAMPVRGVRRWPDRTEVAVQGGAAIRVGDTIGIAVDAERRFALSRAHTLTHVLMASLRLSLTDFASRGADIDESSERIVLRVQSRTLDAGGVSIALEIARRKIAEDPEVIVRSSKTLELAKTIGLFRMDETLDLRGKVRLIEIVGLDVNPCSGTHVASLRLVGSGFYLEGIERDQGRHVLRVRVAAANGGGP